MTTYYRLEGKVPHLDWLPIYSAYSPSSSHILHEQGWTTDRDALVEEYKLLKLEHVMVGIEDYFPLRLVGMSNGKMFIDTAPGEFPDKVPPKPVKGTWKDLFQFVKQMIHERKVQKNVR